MDQRAGRRRDAGHEPPADPESVARLICLDRLSRAPRTRAELATTLRQRLVPDDAAERVLDRLQEVGLIDDRSYAESWVRSRHTSRKLSGRALARELTHKGVDKEDVDFALAGVTTESEEAAATALVRSKLPSLIRADMATRQRRLAAVLGRKGYAADVVWRVVRRETAPDSTDVDDDLPYDPPGD